MNKKENTPDIRAAWASIEESMTGDPLSDLTFGEAIEIPGYGAVKVEKIFPCEEMMRRTGYTEATAYADAHYVVCGKPDVGHGMKFAAAFKDEFARKFLALAQDEKEMDDFLRFFCGETWDTLGVFLHIGCISHMEKTRTWIWAVEGLDFFVKTFDCGNSNDLFTGFASWDEVRKARFFNYGTKRYEYLQESDMTLANERTDVPILSEDDFIRFMDRIPGCRLGLIKKED